MKRKGLLFLLVLIMMAFVLTGCPATIMNPFMGYYPPGYYPTQYAWQLEGWRNLVGQMPPPPGGYPGGRPPVPGYGPYTTGGGATYGGPYATQDAWRGAH